MGIQERNLSLRDREWERANEKQRHTISFEKYNSKYVHGPEIVTTGNETERIQKKFRIYSINFSNIQRIQIYSIL